MNACVHSNIRPETRNDDGSFIWYCDKCDTRYLRVNQAWVIWPVTEWKYRNDPSHIKIRRLQLGEFFANYWMLPPCAPPWRWQIDFGEGRTCIHATFSECVACFYRMIGRDPNQLLLPRGTNDFQCIHASTR